MIWSASLSDYLSCLCSWWPAASVVCVFVRDPITWQLRQQHGQLYIFNLRCLDVKQTGCHNGLIYVSRPWSIRATTGTECCFSTCWKPVRVCVWWGNWSSYGSLRQWQACSQRCCWQGFMFSDEYTQDAMQLDSWRMASLRAIMGIVTDAAWLVLPFNPGPSLLHQCVMWSWRYPSHGPHSHAPLCVQYWTTRG